MMKATKNKILFPFFSCCSKNSWTFLLVFTTSALLCIWQFNSLDKDKDILVNEHLCEVKADEFIWSHRAKSPSGHVDGSMAATRSLLSAGIRNFDVDISLLSSDREENLVVAHPTQIQQHDGNKSSSSRIQTLQKFLQQLSKEKSGKEIHVTLEPKFSFSDTKTMLSFVTELRNVPPSLVVAIIVSTKQSLEIVESILNKDPNSHNIKIAIAYRSKPLGTDFLPWTPTPLSRHTFFPQLHMPDVALLTGPRVTQRADAAGSPDGVIAWIVDAEDSLLRALDLGATGVVTNRPVELLRAMERMQWEAGCASTPRRLSTPPHRATLHLGDSQTA